ncbi:hypothetical protein [Longimicrobium sp.]|uniref:hypothetical protein n=1 Tax=Longimicrobium sp. TaxID=2029185 RepID=UPI002B5E8DC1|nr:hypothetical protein [Longimicrobium sp.]HSU13228.1 hypothetical protein [Longimicrobium sp.]
MTRISRIFRTLAAAACLLAAACSDTSGTGQPAQQGKYQVLIYDEATQQVYAQVFADGTVQGGIAVPTGGQRHLILRLLTDTNVPAGIGPGDEVRVNVTNTVVAGFHLDSQQANVLHGTLTGGSQGATTLRVQYIQGGFTVYQSPSVGVTVS